MAGARVCYWWSFAAIACAVNERSIDRRAAGAVTSVRIRPHRVWPGFEMR